MRALHGASWCQLIDLLSPFALCSRHQRASWVHHHLFKPPLCEREKRSSRTMSGPPPTFPTPNVTRSSAYPPPGSVYPPQSESALYQLGVCAICDIESQGFLASSHGSYPPQQPAIYSTSQPHQPPLAHQTRDPYSANTHAPASTYSYSSSPSQPAHLPVSGAPQAPQTIPIPSVPGGYGAFTNFSGAPPPPPMVQRVATMPTPGQGHNPHSVPYHNVPAPVIAQPSHSGMSGGTRPVTGDWSHRACIVSIFYQNTTIDCRREWNR